MTLQVRVAEKSYSSTEKILSSIEFVVPNGTITCLYGPSGCGKSTLLRIIAGLDQGYGGEISLDDKEVTEPTKMIGLVVQAQVTYNWLSVAENIAFSLRFSSHQRGLFRRLFGGAEPSKVSEEAKRLALIVGLSESDLKKYPEELSGGMKQRMAFARALLPGPQVLLLDEPFSSLDFESRQALQDVVLRVREELGTSFVCVSHDPEEVLYLSDQVVILGGKPATIVHKREEKLSFVDKEDIRYTPEFQQAKKELRLWLNNSSH